jgi:sugar phosphate isomerase/epimerase
LGVQLRPELGDGWQAEVKELRAVVGTFPGPRHLHAQTFDRRAEWPLMSELYERAWRAALILGCRSVLYHPYLVPLRERGAELARWLGYWRAMARRAELDGLELALENVYDRGPDEIRTIVDDAASPNLGTCVDLAHASLFASDHDPVAWLAAMGERVRQVHLSDNDRSHDQHAALGDGSLDVAGFLRQLTRTRRPIALVLEVRTLEATQRSVAYLRELGVSGAQA